MVSRTWPLLLLMASLVLPPAPAFHPPYQDDTEATVEALLEEMSPEDRVGQLFLVTFYGADVGPESDIARLIQEYRVGGVVLLASHDNFPMEGGAELPTQAQALITSLQTLAAEGTSSEEAESPYIPLFIGIEHEGDSWPHTEILSGLTPLPSEMALGATWDPAHAEATGQTVGVELSAMGFNLVLGPSADVLGTPQPSTTGDLGTRSFGGEPYWVSQMTAAYVRGIHVGSEGRIAVVPGHFPGYGGADRSATIEVPTVRRSLDQLTQVDLAPFFAVTGNTADPLEQTDGLMTGHIRYLGFQGDNPRLPTRPISLDAQALGVLMTLEPIAAWREEGGFIMSDALGLRGISRYYDPAGTTFRNRRIAQDAFLAGNDILYLNEFGQEPELDQTETIIDTIAFFVQTYNSDPTFQTRVDEAVRRILRAKLELYGRLDLSNVVPRANALEQIGQGSEATFNAAEDAVTLLSPMQVEQVTPPQLGENIVIFTDTRTFQQCSTCPAKPLIAADALGTAILRLYGPVGTRAINTSDVESYSFQQLATYLATGTSGIIEAEEGGGEAPESGEATPTPEPDPVEVALNNAEWIVFVMLDVSPDVPYSDTVRQFLAERPDVATRARVVVMAMGAPYYLDATEVSKLDAYYALYGTTEPFVNVAARALFQGVTPHGASPVSISAINYDIIEATSPDPLQVISLVIEEETAEAEEGGATPPAPVLEQGDALDIRTGVIMDHNGNPVPDGTPVEFVLDYASQGIRDTERMTTVDGVARISLLLNAGELRISASSEPAMLSDTIQVVIPETGGGTVSRAPLVPPTPTPTPPRETPTPADTHTPTPTTAPVEGEQGHQRHVDFGDLLLTMVGLLALGSGAFWYENVWRDKGLNVGLLVALAPIVGGLLAYNYYAMVLPGAEAWGGFIGEGWGAATAAWMGGLVSLGTVALVLYRDHLRQNRGRR
jgi:beta-N-acetylhexosaminidase